jgi:hypothetical protein
MAEEVDGVGNKGSGDNSTASVSALLETFLEDFQTWEYFPQTVKISEFLEYQHSH